MLKSMTFKFAHFGNISLSNNPLQPGLVVGLCFAIYLAIDSCCRMNLMRKIYLKQFWQKLALAYLVASLLLVQSLALAHAAVHFSHSANSILANSATISHKAHTAQTTQTAPLQTSQFANLIDENSCEIWELVSAKSFTPAEGYAVSFAQFAQPDLVVAQFAAVLAQSFPFFYSQAPPKIS